MPLIRKPLDPLRAQSLPPAEDVLRALVNGNQEERWAAARAAADVPGGADALAKALSSESDPRVREAMFTSLARPGSPAIDALVRFLRSDDASLRTGALDVLRMLHDVDRQLLPTLMNDPDNDVRVLSCEVVRGFASNEATQLLCDLLSREKEPNVCAAAVDVLAEVGTAAALPILAECEARFRHTPFLAFAIKVATARIIEQSK